MNNLGKVKSLRANYQAVKNALPWLDACYRAEDMPEFRSAVVKKPDELPDVSSLEFILHTEMSFEQIETYAKNNPQKNIVIESGPRKLSYHIVDIEKALIKCENLYLCTYNFCNWKGHEQLIEAGLGKKLLYGSHSPRFDANFTMGPIIMGGFDWETKCDIAGNNLRRLLGMDLESRNEVKFMPTEPFIIDTHAHNVQVGHKNPNPMPSPNERSNKEDWLNFMKSIALDKIFFAPSEALFSPEKYSSEQCFDYLEDSENFYYYEIFNPKGDKEHIRRFLHGLGNDKCIGIKIHPSFHGVAADDDSYAPVYRYAMEYEKPIMSHTWEVSAYNPTQYLSHPERFHRFLKDFKEPFIMAHAGGRPGAIDAVEQTCKKFDNVWVDIAGDYYDNCLIEELLSRIGIEKILYADDVDWADPRCHLSMVLGSTLNDEYTLKVLRTNALKVFKRL